MHVYSSRQCATACFCRSCKWSLRVEMRWGISYRRYSQPHSKLSMALFNLDVKYEGVGRRKASCSIAWRCAECCRHFASPFCSPHTFPALVCLCNWLKAPKPSRSRINETDGIEVLSQLTTLYELLIYVCSAGNGHEIFRLLELDVYKKKSWPIQPQHLKIGDEKSRRISVYFSIDWSFLNILEISRYIFLTIFLWPILLQFLLPLPYGY
jgi:hypothetical protein